MAIEIPHEVALFLNFIGVPYPDINEDQVRELASHVRTFADEVSGTHQAATGAITDMGSVYQGQSYRALVASWASLSSSHMERLDDLCRAVAKALEIAAEVITVVKVAVLTELALLAAAYTATMAATIATSGSSALMGQTIALAAKRLIKSMEEMLVAYIVAEVLGKAIEPLEEAVSDMINGVVYNAAADLLGVDGGGNDALYIDPDEVRRYAQVLDDHADDIVAHAEKFANGVAALDFTTPVAMPAAGAPPVSTSGSSGTRGPAAQHQLGNAPAEVAAAPRNWIPSAAASSDTSTSPTGSPGESTAPGAPGKSGAVSPAADPATAGSRGGPASGTPTEPGAAGGSGAEIPPAGTQSIEPQPNVPRSERPPEAGWGSSAAPIAAPAAVPAEGAPGGGTASSPDVAAERLGGPADGAGGESVPAGQTHGTAPAETAGPGPVAAGGEATQASPWNRQSPGSGGQGGAAPAGRSRRRSGGDGERVGRTAGGRRRRAIRPNPWAARPAAGPEPARTPWARPSDRPAPAAPAVTAEGDSRPAPAPDRRTVRENEDVGKGPQDRAASAPAPAVEAPAVSAPARADEGPPPRV